VAWNAFVPKLWTRNIDAVKRELARLSRQRGGTPARLRYAKVADFQARGAGRQVRPVTVARGVPGAEVTEQQVAGYLAKYAAKATEPAGHLSTRLTDSTVRPYTDPARHTLAG
jgi:hypothetical protein